MPSTPPVLDRAMQSLIRIQILTPLSILISIGALAVGTFIVRPSMSDISARHFTYVSPRDSLLLIYWAVLYFAQIGFALFITLASGNEHVKVRHPLHFDDILILTLCSCRASSRAASACAWRSPTSCWQSRMTSHIPMRRSTATRACRLRPSTASPGRDYCFETPLAVHLAAAPRAPRS